MVYKKRYEEWLNKDKFDEETIKELEAIKDDENEIRDRFYQNLSFGTAGLRGILGAGTNRMNNYTVGLATQAFADTIKDKGKEAMDKGVVICYDVRHMSKEFSELAASIFAANGIKVYIFEELAPTPILSWAIRYLGAKAGLMVTASHNPKEYNGYKAYWEEGSQILEDIAESIESKIQAYGSYDAIKSIDFGEGLEDGIIEYVDDKVIDDYIKDVLSYAINDGDEIAKDINVVFSPLNGTGYKPIMRVLEERGFTNINLVKEQAEPDPDFTTVGYPNPEDPKAFGYAEELGIEVGAELLLATDPDCDRVAIEVKRDDGTYEFFNGNKIGSLLIYYILSQLSEKGKLPEDGVIVKSIVTGDMSKAIAKDYGIEVKEVLTGFKNIAGLANEYEETGEKTFLFGYEESIGYTYGDSVRDKDAVNATMMIVEMAAYYKKQGKNLIQVLEELFEKYGYYSNDLISITLEGQDGQAQIQRIMDDFRENPIQEIAGHELEETTDYLNDDTGNPKSNVLKYRLEGGTWYALRPSGTEPKIKLYIYSRGKSHEDASHIVEEVEKNGREKMLAVE